MQVDYRSPEYNEQNRASIFYAQSWALVHYFMLGDEGAHRLPFASYLHQMEGGDADEVTARQALGDLGQLGRALEAYVRRPSFTYTRTKLTSEAAHATMESREITEPEALALRGDFHLARGQPQAARPLLEQAADRAPDLASAQASLGLLNLREQKLDEARRRVARAAELDSTNYLIHYLNAILNMGPRETRESLAPAQQSLERSISLNHDFAPAYSLLAEVSAYRSGDYVGALALARRAVVLEPGVVGHRLSVGRLLVAMGKYDEATLEGNRALAAARSEEDREAAQRFLATIVASIPASASTPSPQQAVASPVEAAGSAPAPDADDGSRAGPRPVTARGVIVSMTCRPSGELLFVVDTSRGRLTLRADAPDQVFLRKNGALIQMDWTCGALRIPATVDYLPTQGPRGKGSADGTVVSFGLDPAP